jgi:hypothetical protein
MSLAEKLDTIRAGGAKRIPADKQAIMHRVTADLRASGILDRAIKVGARLPPFMLRNAHGQEVRSPDLLAKGAVVLTVFRGSW